MIWVLVFSVIFFGLVVAGALVTIASSMVLIERHLQDQTDMIQNHLRYRAMENHR